MPFNRFKTIDGKTVDAILGPEMRSTGEVMGFDADFGTAFAKAQTAAYGSLPLSGRVFVSMANRDKRTMIFPVKRLADLGYEILAPRAPPRCCAATGSRRPSCASTARATAPTARRPSSARSSTARSTWS